MKLKVLAIAFGVILVSGFSAQASDNSANNNNISIQSNAQKSIIEKSLDQRIKARAKIYSEYIYENLEFYSNYPTTTSIKNKNSFLKACSKNHTGLTFDRNALWDYLSKIEKININLKNIFLGMYLNTKLYSFENYINLHQKVLKVINKVNPNQPRNIDFSFWVAHLFTGLDLTEENIKALYKISTERWSDVFVNVFRELSIHGSSLKISNANILLFQCNLIETGNYYWDMPLKKSSSLVDLLKTYECDKQKLAEALYQLSKRKKLSRSIYDSLTVIPSKDRLVFCKAMEKLSTIKENEFNNLLIYFLAKHSKQPDLLKKIIYLTPIIKAKNLGSYFSHYACDEKALVEIINCKTSTIARFTQLFPLDFQPIDNIHKINYCLSIFTKLDQADLYPAIIKDMYATWVATRTRSYFGVNYDLTSLESSKISAVLKLMGHAKEKGILENINVAKVLLMSFITEDWTYQKLKKVSSYLAKEKEWLNDLTSHSSNMDKFKNFIKICVHTPKDYSLDKNTLDNFKNAAIKSNYINVDITSTKNDKIKSIIYNLFLRDPNLFMNKLYWQKFYSEIKNNDCKTIRYIMKNFRASEQKTFMKSFFSIQITEPDKLEKILTVLNKTNNKDRSFYVKILERLSQKALIKREKGGFINDISDKLPKILEFSSELKPKHREEIIDLSLDIIEDSFKQCPQGHTDAMLEACEYVIPLLGQLYSENEKLDKEFYKAFYKKALINKLSYLDNDGFYDKLLLNIKNSKISLSTYHQLLKPLMDKNPGEYFLNLDILNLFNKKGRSVEDMQKLISKVYKLQNCVDNVFKNKEYTTDFFSIFAFMTQKKIDDRIDNIKKYKNVFDKFIATYSSIEKNEDVHNYYQVIFKSFIIYVDSDKLVHLPKIIDLTTCIFPKRNCSATLGNLISWQGNCIYGKHLEEVVRISAKLIKNYNSIWIKLPLFTSLMGLPKDALQDAVKIFARKEIFEKINNNFGANFRALFLTSLFDHSHWDIQTLKKAWIKSLYNAEIEIVQPTVRCIMNYQDILSLNEMDTFTNELVLAGIRIENKDDYDSPFTVYNNLKKKRLQKVTNFGKMPQEIQHGCTLELWPSYFENNLQAQTIRLCDLENAKSYYPYFIQKVETFKLLNTLDRHFSNNNSNNNNNNDEGSTSPFNKFVMNCTGKTWDILQAGTLGSAYLENLVNFNGIEEKDLISLNQARFCSILKFAQSFSDTKGKLTFDQKENRIKIFEARQVSNNNSHEKSVEYVETKTFSVPDSETEILKQLNSIETCSSGEFKGQKILFSEADEKLIGLLGSIESCLGGKSEGIQVLYLTLPTRYRALKVESEKTVDPCVERINHKLIEIVEEKIAGGSNNFYKIICGMKPFETVEQAPHQAIYVRNLFSYLGPIQFDAHTKMINWILLNRSRDFVAKELYKFIRPSHVIVAVNNYLNELLAIEASKTTKKQKAKIQDKEGITYMVIHNYLGKTEDYMGHQVYDFDLKTGATKITPAGTILLLDKMGVIKATPKSSKANNNELVLEIN